MPYCPKCGVELDYKIKNCPLCKFPMPKIEADLPQPLQENKFPKPENIYYENLLKIKNQIFFTISILLFSFIMVLITIDSLVNLQSYAIGYGIISIVAGWFYLFLIFGYVRNSYFSVLGLGATTLFLTFGLDHFDGKYTWAFDYSMPIVILSVSILLLFINFYKKSKHKNQFVFVPFYLCIMISIFSIGVECILTYEWNRHIKLSWSLIVLIVFMSIAFSLITLYYRIPTRMKEKLKRKLHI